MCVCVSLFQKVMFSICASWSISAKHPLRRMCTVKDLFWVLTFFPLRIPEKMYSCLVFKKKKKERKSWVKNVSLNLDSQSVYFSVWLRHVNALKCTNLTQMQRLSSQQRSQNTEEVSNGSKRTQLRQKKQVHFSWKMLLNIHTHTLLHAFYVKVGWGWGQGR